MVRLLRSTVLIAFITFFKPVQMKLQLEQCEDQYVKHGRIKGKKHTMCMGGKVGEGENSELKEIQLIVDLHNKLRSDPKTSHTAEHMCHLYWDPNIAKIAQHYAETCPDGHDKNRDVPGYNIVAGQNLAWGYKSWQDAIHGWFAEVNHFKWGTGSKSGEAVGHYTQIVVDDVCRLGCGWAKCPNPRLGGDRGTFVCNYVPGQMYDDLKQPFDPGKPCSGCPDHCVDKKCDCGGKLCYNKGTLDFKTCKCKCGKIFSGDQCEILNCPKKEHFACEKQRTKADCKRYSNVPGECPKLCGICTKDGKAGPNFISAPETSLMAGSVGKDKDVPAGKIKPSGGSSTGGGKSAAGGAGDGKGKCEEPVWCSKSFVTKGCIIPEALYTHKGTKKAVKDWCPKECKECGPGSDCKDIASWCRGKFAKSKCGDSVYKFRWQGERKSANEFCPKACEVCGVRLEVDNSLL